MQLFTSQLHNTPFFINISNILIDFHNNKLYTITNDLNTLQEASMDFKQLQSFIAVVRCKSFTEAAEELGISQTTISTHIRIL